MPDTVPVAEIGDTTSGYVPHLLRDKSDAQLHLTAAYRLLALNLGEQAREWSARKRVSPGSRGQG